MRRPGELTQARMQRGIHAHEAAALMALRNRPVSGQRLHRVYIRDFAKSRCPAELLADIVALSFAVSLIPQQLPEFRHDAP
jgi:hypothetical protein